MGSMPAVATCSISGGADPLLYFAMHTQPVQAGVVVTGSHNPAEYNGFKIVIGDRVLDGDDLLALASTHARGRSVGQWFGEARRPGR